MAEQFAVNEKVAGSSPAQGAKKKDSLGLFFFFTQAEQIFIPNA